MRGRKVSEMRTLAYQQHPLATARPHVSSNAHRILARPSRPLRNRGYDRARARVVRTRSRISPRAPRIRRWAGRGQHRSHACNPTPPRRGTFSVVEGASSRVDRGTPAAFHTGRNGDVRAGRSRAVGESSFQRHVRLHARRAARKESWPDPAGRGDQSRDGRADEAGGARSRALPRNDPELPQEWVAVLGRGRHHADPR